MLKLLHPKEEKRHEIEAVLELVGLDEELTGLAAILLACDPSRFSKKKEKLKFELLKTVNPLSKKTDVLPDEELDYAAGGIAGKEEIQLAFPNFQKKGR